MFYEVYDTDSLFLRVIYNPGDFANSVNATKILYITLATLQIRSMPPKSNKFVLAVPDKYLCKFRYNPSNCL